MGSRPSTIPEQFDFTSENIIPESRENRRVIVQHKPVEVRDVVCFTGRAFSLSNKRTDIFTLAIQGGGVLRIGLTDEDPMTNEEFYKDPVFEQEDGFELGESSRGLFYDKMLDMFCYGRRDEHMEFSPIRKFRESSMYLYVIFIYGRQIVSVVHGKDTIDLTHYKGSNVENRQDRSVSLKTVKNLSMMKVRSRVDFRSCYHIHWDMGLSQENIGGKIPKFGYLRLGISSESVADTQIQTYSINTFDPSNKYTAWFTESAVAEFPYSGTIGLKLSPHISHNLTTMSVGKTKEETAITNPVNMLIEASSGTFTIERSVHFTVKQYAGTRLFVKDYDELENSTATKFKVSTVVSHDPYHIQYGPNPRSFMVMFNKRFTTTDTAVFKREFKTSRELKDTDTVQALYKDGTLDKDIVEEAFGRQQLVGGREIHSVKPSNELQRCWIIRYNKEEDAERVWMRRAIVVEGVSVTILPWYEELGVAVNFGEKPVFDDTDLVISGLDQNKMSFIVENKDQRLLLEKYISKEVPVLIQWPQSDGYEGSEIEEIQLTVTCHVKKCSHVKRAQWKQTVSEMVQSYMKKKIHMHVITVDETHFDSILGMLHRKKQDQKNWFKFSAKRAILTFTLITSDRDLSVTLQEKIQEIQNLIIDKITITIERDNVERYHALDAEGVLDRIRKECPNTRFVVSDNGVKLSGPKDEVQKAEKNILHLVVSTTNIQVRVSSGLKKLLESPEGKMSLEEKLQGNRLCERFKVEGEFCKLWIFQENPEDVRTKANIFEQALQANYFEKTFTFKEEMIKNLQMISHEELIRQLDLGNHVFIEVDRKKAVIRICGMQEEIQKIETRMQKYQTEVLQSKKSVPVMLSLDAIEYIHTWDDKLTTAPYSVQKQDDEPCGLLISAPESDIKKLEEELLKMAGKIKSFWFYITRPWLAVERDQIKDTVHSFSNDLQCNVDIATSSLLAHDKISSVAIEEKSGTIFISMSSDIFKSKVDAIIIQTEDPTLKLSTGFAKKARHEGGKSLINECDQYVKDNGELKPFDTAMVGSGNLSCQTVIIVHVPTTEVKSDSSMANAITACLKKAQSKRFVSVMVPVIQFCQTNDTGKSLDAITKAIDAFVTKNSDGNLKEIGLCDMRVEIVKQIEISMTASLKQTWFVFKHSREIKGIRLNNDKSVRRPLTSRDRRSRLVDDGLRWGIKMPRMENPNLDDDDDDDEEEPIVLPDRTVFENGLPYKIPLKANLTLSITKGQLEKMKSAVIVNPTPLFPDLVGAISNAIVKAGGQSIKDECKRHGRIAPGEVKVTDSGNLSCKKLYHVLQPMEWDDATGSESVHMIVTQCLLTASNAGLSSISFPSIGTGASQFPVDKVAEAMVKAVLDFIVGCPNSPLRSIDIVLYYTDNATIKRFEELVPKLISPTSDRITDSRQHQAEETGSGIKTGIKETQFLTSIRGGTSRNYSSEDDVMMVKITLKGDTSDAKKQFLKRIELEFVKEEEKFDLPDVTKDEIRRLEDLTIDCHVLVQIDIPKKKIMLQGLKQNIYNAGMKLNQLLKFDFLAERNAKKMREDVTRYIQWFYDDNGELKPYDDMSNFDIHFAFLEQKDFIYHNISEDRKYQVWIHSLEEHPVTDSTRRRQMVQRQKVANDINIPDTWIIRSNGKDREEVDLDPTSPEYDEVKKKFLGAGCPATGIVNIKRIEDKYKYLQYMSKKKQLENQNPKGTRNAMELWHGTDADTCGLIIKDGFNRSFAGKNATRFGNGVYFATTSRYSNGFAPPDPSGVCRMFLSKVLVGMFCQGNGNMFVLPVRNTVKNIKICYDSAVDDTKNPGGEELKYCPKY